MKFFVTAFLLTITLFGFTAHKYYVTIAEANHSNASEKLEISLKFIGHDLESVLEKEGITNLYLGTPKEVKNADELLLNYISTHFTVLINDNKQQLSFFGKEVKPNDDIFCYLETKPIQEIKSIEVQSDLFVEYFKEHVTIVYLTIGEQRFNFRLNSEKTNEKHFLTKM